MFKNVILNYASKITKNDIDNFAKSNNVELKNYEIDVIYNEVKNNVANWLENTDEALKKIKDKLEQQTYLEIKKLVIFYKEKYQNYL